MTHSASLTSTEKTILITWQHEEAIPTILLFLIEWRKMRKNTVIIQKTKICQTLLKIKNIIPHFYIKVGNAHQKD